MFWVTVVTTLGIGRTNNEASTAISSTELCSRVGKTTKLADKTANNLFSLCEMSATWLDTFSNKCSKTLTHKARIATSGIELLTDPMSILVLMNSVEDKFLGELLTTEAQVTPLKETEQDTKAYDKPAQMRLIPLNTSVKQMAAFLASLESKHMTAHWAHA
ncbi:hypothetical protein G9A89_003434 [Geosiphon pyriformis]|nr:hypothetical protein G9A89_003434 [Geosiphon pyriformis]